MQAARILVFSAVLLAACGGSPGGSGEGTSTGGASTEGSTAGTGLEGSGSTSSTSTGEPTPTSTSGSGPGETTEVSTGASTEVSTDTGTDASSSTSTGEPASEAWIQGFGAPESQHPGGLGFAAGGDLWVAGDVYGSIDLGAGLRAPEGTGIYLARYAATGEALQVRSFAPANGEPTLTQVAGLAVDGTGAVIVTGWLEGTYTLGGSELIADEVDFYVAKWDAAGEPVWGQKFGGVDWQVSAAIAVGPEDSVWVGGAALAPFEMGDIALTGAASTGMFVARLAADGTPLLGKWWGETGDQEIRSIAVCDDGSLAVGGFFNDSLSFGGEMVVATGAKDMFVARVDVQGEPTWIRAHGGTGVGYVAQVACADAVGFAGVVSGTAKVGELVLDPGADADVVLARVELDGTLSAAVAITGPQDQLVTGLAMLPGGDTAVVLTSAGTVTLGEMEYASAGERDLVFARYAPSADTPKQLVGLGDAAQQRSGPLAVHSSGVAAIAGSFAGEVTWPGLPPVSSAGAEDLLLVRFTPGP